jgi:transcriptional regulator with XRE-family HTH domain
MLIGSKIRQRRKEKGFKTQGDLAKALGVSHVTVSGWERDEFRPDGDNILALIRVLGTDFGLQDNIKDKSTWLFGDTFTNQSRINEANTQYNLVPTPEPFISSELKKYIFALIKADQSSQISQRRLKLLRLLLKEETEQ